MLGRRSARRGFTLLELLIVCAIIGILAVLLLSRLERAITRARLAQTVTNMRVLQRAVEMYVGAHQGDPPGVLTGGMVGAGCGAADWQGSGGVQTCTGIQPYLTRLPENTLNVPAVNGRDFVWSSEKFDKWQQYPSSGEGGFFYSRRYYLVMLNSWDLFDDGRYYYEIGQAWQPNGVRWDQGGAPVPFW